MFDKLNKITSVYTIVITILTMLALGIMINSYTSVRSANNIMQHTQSIKTYHTEIKNNVEIQSFRTNKYRVVSALHVKDNNDDLITIEEVRYDVVTENKIKDTINIQYNELLIIKQQVDKILNNEK